VHDWIQDPQGGWAAETHGLAERFDGKPIRHPSNTSNHKKEARHAR